MQSTLVQKWGTLKQYQAAKEALAQANKYKEPERKSLKAAKLAEQLCS